MCVGATMTVELEGAGARMEVFADNQYSAWVATWGGSPLTYTRTLNSEDVTKLKNGNYTIKIAVYEGGTCKSVTFSGGAVCSHTYSNDHTTWTADADGIYHRACTLCGAMEKGVNYYEFTVYPESAITQTVYASSWTPSADKPNSIALVKIKSGLEAYISGYNIVNSTKNIAGNQTCADFRLTDGHPYYSDKKFVAAKATYTRLLGADEEYGMMTLPFKHQNAENEDAEFYHIEKVEGDKIRLVAIDPSVEGNASAYIPVIFKRKAGKNSITVTGTDITVKKTSADKTNSTCEGWTIKGAVESTSVTAADGNNLYEVADSKLGNVSKTSGLTIAPFRACLITTATAPDILTFLCPRAAEASVSSLVNAIKKLTDGDMTVEEIDNIVEELLNQ